MVESRTRTTRTLVVIGAAAVILALGLILILTGHHARRPASRGRAATTDRRGLASPSTTRQATFEAKPPNTITSAEQLRRTYEHELEARIEADAHLMVSEKVFQGPILGVTCTPMERGGHPVVADTVHFNCLAIKKRIPTSLGITLEGARYFAEINFSTGTSTYGGH